MASSFIARRRGFTARVILGFLRGRGLIAGSMFWRGIAAGCGQRFGYPSLGNYFDPLIAHGIHLAVRR
jgi:hypothetical protein